MATTFALSGELSKIGNVSGGIANQKTISGSVTNNLDKIYSPYMGSVEVTPGETLQILETKNKAMLSNIRINPIPSNYGLITWDGSIITIT